MCYVHFSDFIFIEPTRRSKVTFQVVSACWKLSFHFNIKGCYDFWIICILKYSDKHFQFSVDDIDFFVVVAWVCYLLYYMHHYGCLCFILRLNGLILPAQSLKTKLFEISRFGETNCKLRCGRYSQFQFQCMFHFTVNFSCKICTKRTKEIFTTFGLLGRNAHRFRGSTDYTCKRRIRLTFDHPFSLSVHSAH